MRPTTHRTFIGIGSNLDQPIRQVHRAIEKLSLLPQSHLVARSRWFQSKAIGPGSQNDYINGVALLETTLSADSLLNELQQIEHDAGRVRAERWGPRTLDLDILLFDNLILETSRLTLPHPRLLERAFVLLPLYDLVPEWIFADGVPLQTLVQTDFSALCWPYVEPNHR